MNTIESDTTLHSTQTTPRTLLYFRFRKDVGAAIQQVEYDLLQTNLSEHRGYDDTANDLWHDGYWAVVTTSESGVGADADEYTANYLRSMPVVDGSSITATPPLVNPV